MREWKSDSRFLNSKLVGGECSASLTGRITLKERVPNMHWIRDWGNPRDGLEIVENIKFLTLPGPEI
jgi:hypothetical protein